MVASLVLNWVVAPAFMFVLAWIFLPDLPEYRTGLIIVGLARCIAMVFIWNDLACGDREAAAVLVAINSVFQVVAFGALGWFYLQVLPGWLGLPTTGARVLRLGHPAHVLVFLGIPLLAGFLTRRLGEKAKGRDWYEDTFLPRIGPFALYGLLFTIVVLFALQGDAITRQAAGRRPHRAAAAGLLRVICGAGMLLGHGHRAGLRSAPRPWRSPPPATTSNWPSPSPSPPSASPPARPWPASSARSSRCPVLVGLVYVASGPAGSSRHPHPTDHARRPPHERHR